MTGLGLKMEAVSSAEALAPVYKYTRSYNSEDQQRRENFKFQMATVRSNVSESRSCFILAEIQMELPGQELFVTLTYR